MGGVIGRETVLKNIKHSHDIEDATVIGVLLRGGVPTAVSPRGEVLEASELGAEGGGYVRLGQLGCYLARKPVANGGYFAVSRPRGRERVRMEDNTLIQK